MQNRTPIWKQPIKVNQSPICPFQRPVWLQCTKTLTGRSPPFSISMGDTYAICTKLGHQSIQCCTFDCNLYTMYIHALNGILYGTASQKLTHGSHFRIQFYGKYEHWTFNMHCNTYTHSFLLVFGIFCADTFSWVVE